MITIANEKTICVTHVTYVKEKNYEKEIRSNCSGSYSCYGSISRMWLHEHNG